MATVALGAGTPTLSLISAATAASAVGMTLPAAPDILGAAIRFLARTFPALTPAAPLHVTPSIMAGLLIFAVAVSVPSFTWRWFGLLTTLVHELGHAVTAVLTGRTVTDIQVHRNHSGSVLSSGVSGFSAVISGFSGYPAPALVGTATLWLVFHGWASLTLLAATVIVGLTVFLIRNVFGWLVVAAAAGSAWALYAYAPHTLQAHTLLVVGVALLIGSVRELITVISVHVRRRDELESSDAYILWRLTFIPSPLWILGFAAVIGWSMWAAVGTYLATF